MHAYLEDAQTDVVRRQLTAYVPAVEVVRQRRLPLRNTNNSIEKINIYSFKNNLTFYFNSLYFNTLFKLEKRLN